MTRLLIAVLTALALTSAPAAADPTADAAIERVIADQIAAFQRDDLTAAFAHASPRIQSQFGTPRNFGRMVQRGYPMIYRPARYEWRALAERGGAFVKTVLFEDATGRLFEADYLMARSDGRWRIAGVSLREVPGLSS